MVIKFKKGDICACVYPLTTRKDPKRRFGCIVRITSLDGESDNGYCYNVYNITLNRYEKIGGYYLRLLIGETRDEKLKKLLDGII